MKRHINLYGPEFRPRRVWASLNQIVGLWGLVLLLALICAGTMIWQQRELARQQSELRAQLATRRAESAQLDARLAKHQSSPVLNTQLTDVRGRIASMQLMLQQLGKLAPERGESYAALMADLARIQDDHLALSRIRFEGGRVSLGGQTRGSHDVPQWVSRFRTTPTLSGKEFSELQLNRDKQGVLQFQLGGLPKAVQQ